MVIGIIVDGEVDDDIIGSMVTDEVVTLTGRIVTVNSEDDALNKAYEKVEQFENLISMGLIDQDVLNEIGYKE